MKLLKSSICKWLVVLLIPFIIGMLIHFLIPFVIAIQAFPRAEKVFNDYKIQAEQVSIRTLSILNTRVIRNRIQTYEQIRSLQFHIFQTNNPKTLVTNIQKYPLNYAGSITPTTSTSQLNAASMWFVSGKNNTSQFNSIEQNFYQRYQEVQPYIIATLSNTQQRELPGLQITFNYEGSQMLFQFPSRFRQRYLDKNYDVRNQGYNLTVQYWKKTGEQYMTFKDGTDAKICSILLQNNTNIGVVCLNVDVVHLALQLTNLGVPTFDYSSNQYYLITPFYGNIGMNNAGVPPKILFNYNDRDLSKVTFPEDQVFIDNSTDKHNKWYPIQNYIVHSQQISSTLTQFAVPIDIFNYNNKKTVVLFMVTQNNFRSTSFQIQSKTRRALLAILIPSIILIVISIILVTIVLKCLLSDLRNAIVKLNKTSSYILQGQINVVAPIYDQTADLRIIYDLFATLNELHRITSPTFYACSTNQRLTNYFHIEKLFEKLGYQTILVSQRIGDCYFFLKQFKQAAVYYSKSFYLTQMQIYKRFGDINTNSITKDQIILLKKNPSYKLAENILKRRLMKMILCQLWTIDNDQSIKTLQRCFDYFKKLLNKGICDHVNLSILLMKAKFQLLIGEKTKILKTFQNIQNMIAGFEKNYSKRKRICEDKDSSSQNCEVNTIENHPDTYRQTLRFLYAMYDLEFANNHKNACHHFIKALQHRHSLPSTQNQISIELMNLLSQNSLLDNRVKGSYYFTQPNTIRQRQFFFLYDWSIPIVMSKRQANEWRNKCQNRTKQIFNNYLQNGDRLSILKFDDLVQTFCTLTPVHSHNKILFHQIQELCKSKLTVPNCRLKEALDQVKQKIKKLRKYKILLIFLKKGVQIRPRQITPIIKEIQMKSVIFLHEQPLEQYLNHNYMVVNLMHSQDLDRILIRKQDRFIDDCYNPFQ